MFSLNLFFFFFCLSNSSHESIYIAFYSTRFCGHGEDPSVFLLRHPAESISVSQMKRGRGGGVALAEWFSSNKYFHYLTFLAPETLADNTSTGVCFKLCPPKGVRNNTEIYPLSSLLRRVHGTDVSHSFM